MPLVLFISRGFISGRETPLDAVPHPPPFSIGYFGMSLVATVARDLIFWCEGRATWLAVDVLTGVGCCYGIRDVGTISHEMLGIAAAEALRLVLTGNGR